MFSRAHVRGAEVCVCVWGGGGHDELQNVKADQIKTMLPSASNVPASRSVPTASRYIRCTTIAPTNGSVRPFLEGWCDVITGRTPVSISAHPIQTKDEEEEEEEEEERQKRRRKQCAQNRMPTCRTQQTCKSNPTLLWNKAALASKERKRVRNEEIHVSDEDDPDAARLFITKPY